MIKAKKPIYEVTNFKKELVGVFTKEGCCKFLNLSWEGIRTSQKRGVRVGGYYYVNKK